MPSLSIESYIKELINSKKEKFEDSFDLEWNLFSTLSLERSENCLDNKTEAEKLAFKDYFLNSCKTKSEKICFFLKDKHFQKDVDELFQNLIKDSGISNGNKKSAAICRFFIESAKNRIEDQAKSLSKYNMALMYCPYPKDCTNSSDSLLYAKILLKKSELFCLNLKIGDAIQSIKEGFKLLNETDGEERNFLFCKYLYAKSIYLDLIDNKENEKKIFNHITEKTIHKFKLSNYLNDKLKIYYGFLNQVFLDNKQSFRNQFYNKKSNKLIMNELKTNSKLPGSSDEIEMCLIEGKGRCTRVNKAIKKGQLLFCEKPVVEWLRPTNYESYCNNCFIKIQDHFITCFNCIKVRYCSSKCRDAAWDKYHRIECRFLDCLLYLGYGHIVIRTLIIFNQDEMMNVLTRGRNKFLEEIVNDKTIKLDLKVKSKSSSLSSIFDEKDISISSYTDEKKYQLSPRAKIENTKFHDDNYWLINGLSKSDYESFFSLVGDEKHLSYFQLISFCYGVSLIGKLAKKMKIIDENDRLFYIFHSAILSHILKINFNCYSINDHSLKLNGKYNFCTYSNDYSKIGIGVYLSSSIISHSCDYNSNKLSHGSKIIIYSNRDLKKGDEITVTYGPSFKISSFKDRQTLLKNGYLFDCGCNACLNRLENYLNAFRCPNCLDALIWNQDYSSKCMKCGNENQDLQQFAIKLKNLKKEFYLVNELLSKEEYSKCKKKLNYCLKVMRSVFYSDTKLDNLYLKFIDYYYKKGNYYKASKYASILSQLKSDDNEDDCSIESTLYLLKAISLIVLHLKNVYNISIYDRTSNNNQIPKKLITKINDNYRKVLDDFNKINSRQIKLIEQSFISYLDYFQIVEEFLKKFN